MWLKTKETLERYNISRSTLYNYKEVINQYNGHKAGKTRQEGGLYDTEVLDKLARDGELGINPQQAILNLDVRTKYKHI